MRPVLFCLLAGLAIGFPGPAAALVRFGHGVFIGGHDFSNQSFGPKRRAVIHLYRRTPHNEGCRWHAEGHGGRVVLCHLRQL